jgi:hypothetical protein
VGAIGGCIFAVEMGYAPRIRDPPPGEPSVFLLVATALAGPMGPAAMTGLFSVPGAVSAEEAEPECGDAYPFELAPMPTGTDLLRIFQPYRSFGTPTMVETLVEASGRVASAYPTADPVFVGDLSLHRGGALPPHRWHHDGRSADIGLFAFDGQQPVHGFETVWSKDLDVEKTWALISALLDTGNIEHILLDQAHILRIKRHVRENELMTAEEMAATFPPVNTPRIWAMHGIVRHAPRHADHMHVRVLCD